MYIVQRQILKVVDNWSIISTALAGLQQLGQVHPISFCVIIISITMVIIITNLCARGETCEWASTIKLSRTLPTGCQLSLLKFSKNILLPRQIFFCGF